MSLYKPIDFCEKVEEESYDCPHGVGSDWCGGTLNADRANAIHEERCPAAKALLEMRLKCGHMANKVAEFEKLEPL